MYQISAGVGEGDPSRRLVAFGHSVVSLAAVFSIVTQRSSPQCGEERCVTILKTAARETSHSGLLPQMINPR